jgi:signal transduction histidine kinase
MPVTGITAALSTFGKDEAVVHYFMTIWPLIESILEAFSKTTRLPIFVYVNDVNIFQSSIGAMPPFCAAMLGAPTTAARCIDDGARRARGDEPEVMKGLELCHAGMLNGRCIRTTCIGSLAVLFGARRATSPEADRRRQEVIRLAEQDDAAVARDLLTAEAADRDALEISLSDSNLMTAITEVVARLIDATVGFRVLTINMAHEISLVMLGLGLLSKEMGSLMTKREQSGTAESILARVAQRQQHIDSETRLGLYVVRNFLSYSSETRYGEVVRPQFTLLDIGALLREMIDLYERHAAARDITFDLSQLASLPRVHGSDMELRRLFHNILSNAVKYSYHSVGSSRRTVRIRSKVPYDPGFRSRRFAISFETYGLGLSKDELKSAFEAGFRGRQAIAEVPVGAGIGLSEAFKIMRVHKGSIRIRSEEVHRDADGRPTYLTIVDTIFPMSTGAPQS